MVLLFLSFCGKNFWAIHWLCPTYPCLHRNSFFISGFLFLSLISLLFFFFVAIYVAHSFLLNAYRAFSEPLQKQVYWPVCRLSARRLLPSINPLVSRFSQRAINLYLCWLNFSSGDRFAALSMTPDAGTTNEFYAEHSSWRHAMPKKFPINFTMLQKSVS